MEVKQKGTWQDSMPEKSQINQATKVKKGRIDMGKNAGKESSK